MEHILSRTSRGEKIQTFSVLTKKKNWWKGEKLEKKKKRFQIRSSMQVPSARNECSQNRNNFDIDFYYKFRILSVDPFLVALAFFLSSKEIVAELSTFFYCRIYLEVWDEVKIFILCTRRDWFFFSNCIIYSMKNSFTETLYCF